MMVDFWELGREYNENRFLNGWFVDRYEMIDKKELNYLLFSLFTEKGSTLFMEELLEYKNKADMLLKIIQLKIVEPEKDKDFKSLERMKLEVERLVLLGSTLMKIKPFLKFGLFKRVLMKVLGNNFLEKVVWSLKFLLNIKKDNVGSVDLLDIFAKIPVGTLTVEENYNFKDFLIFLEKDASSSYYDGNYSLDLALRAILNSNKKLKSDLMQMQRSWLLK